MDLPIVVRAVLIAVFATSGVYCLLRCVRWTRVPACGGGHAHGRTSDLAQVAMSGAMVAMLATGFGGDRWGVQLTVFGVASGWFLTRALPRAGHFLKVAGREGRAGREARPGLERRGGREARPGIEARAGLVNHAVMMAAMFWMSVTMTGPAHLGMSGAATAVVGSSAPASVAFAGYLAVASMWWGRRSLATAGTWGRRSLVTAGTGGLFGVTGAAACHAVTSAAMAALFILRVGA